MNAMLAIFGMGSGELIVVLVAILILFGAKRIPEFAKGLGQGIKEFKKASSEVSNEIHSAMHEPPSAPPANPQTPSAPANPPPSATVPKA